METFNVMQIQPGMRQHICMDYDGEIVSPFVMPHIQPLVFFSGSMLILCIDHAQELISFLQVMRDDADNLIIDDESEAFYPSIEIDRMPFDLYQDSKCVKIDAAKVMECIANAIVRCDAYEYKHFVIND